MLFRSKIEWNTGRTGRVTPLAIFDKVDIDGSMVGKATLHSLRTVKELDVRVGDKILIQKSGDIIPYVVRVLERN